MAEMTKIDHHFGVTTRYLHHRVSTDGSVAHPWTAVIRKTSWMLIQHTKSEHDPAKKRLLEWNACACLAANRGVTVFDDFKRRAGDPMQSEGGIEANCLAVAAWMGDFDLVKSLHKGSDPLSFFGRPSWAAATQGHLEILQFYLDEGALPYEPTYVSGPNFGLWRTPLAAAAYMGHENTVQLLLQQPYYCSEVRDQEELAADFAALGNQANTFTILLDHIKAKITPKRFLGTLDWALVCSCKRGAIATAKVALERGADVDGTDRGPRSCLQLAAISGCVPIAKMLLDAGASTEAPSSIRSRSTGRETPMRKQKDALFEAKKRGHLEIVKLIEERNASSDVLVSA
jgi:ankyrin repeat protein